MNDFTISITNQDIVKEKPVTLVSPKNPTPFETIFLSNIDQAVTFPVETVFFFDVPHDKSSSTLEICLKVKRAVSEVLLVPYYFMAGRLRFNRRTDRLELVCNNGGVLFVSATSRLRLKELGNLSLPNSTFHHFVHRPGLYRILDETALFTIQVTRLACGSFTFGFVTNHAILDGKSASEMFENLASICRGEGFQTKAIYNDRTCLRARNPLQIRYPHKEYVKRNKKSSSFASCFTAPEQSSPSPLIFSRTYVHKVFSFTPEMIESLKKKATVKCSSFEALVGHIWKARSRAVFTNFNDVSSVLFAVDIRSKTSPPLPTSFAGNAVVTASANAKVIDLVEKPFSFCIEKIKEAREKITCEYVKSMIDWLEVYRGTPATCKGNFYVSAWWKLQFNELDFGLGKLVHGGPVVSGNDEFVLLLSNGKNGENGGGINVWLGLEPDKMKKLMAHVFEI